MKPHSRKLLRLPHEEDPPRLLQPPSIPAAAPPSASTIKPLRPPLTQAPFDSSVGLTVLVLLTAIFFMAFFSLYIRRFAEGSEAAAASRRRRRRRPPRDPAGPSPPYYSRAPRERPSCSAARKGLDPAVIRSLPAFVYGGEGAKYQVDCAVCLSDLEEEEVVKAIPWCSHVFHAECIDRWLCARASCPVCRDARLTEAAGRAKADGADGPSAVERAEAREVRSTAASGDTCLEIREDGGEDGGEVGLSVRRSRSWSNFEEGRSLQRRTSF